MTEENRTKIITTIKNDTNEYLLDRYVWYCKNFHPLDDDFIEAYELIKAEVLNRMKIEVKGGK